MWDFFNPIIFVAYGLIIIKNIQPEATKANTTAQSIQRVSTVRHVSKQRKALKPYSRAESSVSLSVFSIGHYNEAVPQT
jgi:hypothetical protein